MASCAASIFVIAFAALSGTADSWSWGGSFFMAKYPPAPAPTPETATPAVDDHESEIKAYDGDANEDEHEPEVTTYVGEGGGDAWTSSLLEMDNGPEESLSHEAAKEAGLIHEHEVKKYEVEVKRQTADAALAMTEEGRHQEALKANQDHHVHVQADVMAQTAQDTEAKPQDAGTGSLAQTAGSTVSQESPESQGSQPPAVTQSATKTEEKDVTAEVGKEHHAEEKKEADDPEHDGASGQSPALLEVKAEEKAPQAEEKNQAKETEAEWSGPYAAEEVPPATGSNGIPSLLDFSRAPQVTTSKAPAVSKKVEQPGISVSRGQFISS